MSANSVKKLLTRLTAVLATTAAGADMVVIQEQVNTTNTAEFDYLYSNSRAEAQAANPAVLTDAEVSTGYGTAGQMATAAKSAHADGIYINATTPPWPNQTLPPRHANRRLLTPGPPERPGAPAATCCGGTRLCCVLSTVPAAAISNDCDAYRRR